MSQYEELIISFEAVLKIEPKLPEALNVKGFALWKLKKYDDALTYLEKAISLKEDYLEAWINKGTVLGNIGLHQKALESFDRAIAIEPKDEIAWFSKGITLSNLGEFIQALEAYQTAKKLLSNTKHEIYANIIYGEACCYCLLNDISNAMKYLEESIKLSPDIKILAKTDKDFQSIRNDKRFIDLVYEL